MEGDIKQRVRKYVKNNLNITVTVNGEFNIDKLAQTIVDAGDKLISKRKLTGKPLI